MIPQNRKNSKFYRWELALLLGVALAALGGSYLSGQQSALADKVVRLHVVGASNSDYDQARKLVARDAVLAAAEPYLEGTASQSEARSALEGHLEEIARAGADALGYTQNVTARLEDGAWFPTKEYTNFALPAGRYTALRVEIGPAQGRNWWCVVFPPLCMGAVSETAAETAGLSENQVDMITGADGGYQLKFRAVELWEQFTDGLSR